MVITGYALWLGASPAVLAALAALPLVAQLGMPIALLLKGTRKGLSFGLAFWGRAFFVLVLLLPFMPPWLRIPCLLLVAAVSQVAVAPLGVLWNSWMADLVVPEARGRYFGFRNAVVGLSGTLGNLAAGRFIDLMPRPTGFLLVLGVAVVVGVISAGLLRLQYEPPSTRKKESAKDLEAPWKDPAFRAYLVFVATWFAGVMCGAPFVFPLFLQYAHMSFAEVGLWTVISATSGLFFGPMWGRVADRTSHRQVVIYTALVASSALPILWLVAAPDQKTTIWISAVLDGLAWSGLGTALNNLVLHLSPPPSRSGYFALFGVALGLGGVVGSGLGGAIGSLGLGPSPYHLPLVVSLAVRLISLLAFALKKEGRPGATPLETRD